VVEVDLPQGACKLAKTTTEQPMAFSIVRHALAMVFGNFGQAMRLSIGPFLIAAGLIYALAEALEIGAVSLMFLAMDPTNSDPLILVFLLVALLIAVFVTAWVAVAWHRFILLEEYVQLMPQLRDRPIGGYVLTSLGIGVWIVLVSFGAGLVLGIFMALTGTGDSIVIGFVGGALIGALSSYVWFRLALVLPGLAIGKRMKLSEAFAATRPLDGTIWQVVFILVFINFLAQTAAGAIAPGSVAVQLILNGVVTWFSFMIGLSVLTTLYGHLMEGRALAG
jgi:hypothetical protein